MPLLFQRTNVEKGNDSLPAALIQEPFRSMDWRVVVSLVSSVIVVWLISLVYTGWNCSQAFVTVCVSQQVVFWTIPFFTFIFFVCAIGITLIYAFNVAWKERFANAFYQHFDSQSYTVDMQKMIIDRVVSEISKSLATGELDTLSQNITSNSTNLGAGEPKKEEDDKSLVAKGTLGIIDSS